MKCRILMLVCVLGLLMTACEKRVNMEIPAVPSKPVLYGLVAEGSPIKLQVNKSYAVLDEVNIDSSTFEVAEAIDTMALYVNGQRHSSLQAEGAWLKAATYTVSTGDKIELKGLSATGDSVVVATEVPTSPTIDSLSFLPLAYYNEDAEPMSQIILYFKDTPGQVNYYEVVLKRRHDSTDVFKSYFNLFSRSPIILNEDILDSEPSTLVFSDKLFDGQSVALPVDFYKSTYNWRTSKDESTEFIEFELTLMHITEAQYVFRKAFMRNKAELDLVTTSTVEPSNLYTNVKGAYGIFATYATDKKTLTYSISN